MARLPALHERTLDDPEDFRRVRSFLAGCYPITSPGLVWDVRMWDGAWHTGAGRAADAERRARMRVFEDDAGSIVAALLSLGDEEIHPQVHPERREIESTLIARGEALVSERGETVAKILCWKHDDPRRHLLTAAGYRRSQRFARLYRATLDTRVEPSVPPPAGYTIRSTDLGAVDHQPLADLLNAAFGRTRHSAGEVRAIQEGAPSFRRDLDLVAEAPDGSLAAYAAVCWDDDNQRGIYEPVCTHPDHRRRGLARALMLAGWKRARALGARSLEVPTGDAAPANALYRSLGFEEEYRGWFWTKPLTSDRAGRSRS